MSNRQRALGAETGGLKMQRKFASLLAVVALISAGVLALFAAPAGAAPYANQASISLSASTVPEGATIGITGQGFGANDTVVLTLHTTTYSLVTAHANASGAFTTSAKLPAGVTGQHTVEAAATPSGSYASAPITITAPGTSSGGGTSSSGSGGLSNTGVAVIGIGAIGVVLLIGGGLMLLAGRRRKAAV